jgi:hypothetical protein
MLIGYYCTVKIGEKDEKVSSRGLFEILVAKLMNDFKILKTICVGSVYFVIDEKVTVKMAY